MKKKIFVTGGNGFIGKSFCAAVCKKFNIVSFDLKIEESLKKFKNIKQVKGTILNEIELYNAMNGCHYVVHLAAALGVENTETNRLECYKVNVEGTKNVLEAAFKRRIKKVVFSSSSEVYGDQGSSKIKEDINLRYMSNYAATKIMGEELLKAYNQKYNLNYNVVRFFNVYGNQQKKNFVISKFINSSKKNVPIYVYGNGEQKRSFCHIDDAVNGLTRVLLKGKKTEVYNIGNDSEPISIFNLSKKIKKIKKHNVKIIKVNYNKSDRNKKRDIKNRIPNINKAKKDLGYKPKISLEEGIKIFN